MPPCEAVTIRCRKCDVLPEKSIYAVEMRFKSILEAFAERIGCFEAHRNAWRNWILEGAHRTFGSQPIVRAATQSIPRREGSSLALDRFASDREKLKR